MPSSDYDDSSVDTPPPPPPSDGGSIPETDGIDKEEQRYQQQLKIFQGMAEFSASRDDDDLRDDEGSVEIPPPENYEEMGAVSKDGSSNRCSMIATCLCVLLGIILGVGFGTGAFTNEKGSSDKGVVETLPPEVDESVDAIATPAPDSREGRIFLHIAAMSQLGDDILSDPTSGEALALQWLIDEDPVDLDPLDFANHLRLEQRYALLTLWFNSPDPWFNVTNWLNDDECTWFGVTCGELTPEARKNRKLQEDASVVTAIEIDSNNLFGTISQDLSILADLQILNLRDNFIGGPLPVALGNLSQLRTITLNDNELTGDLSGFNFSGLVAVKILDLSSNQFSGAIPTTMYSLPAIEILVLNENAFTGEISTSIGNLQTLRKCGSRLMRRKLL